MGPEAVLEFWFGVDVPAGTWQEKRGLWFGGGPEVDAEVTARFGALHERAARGELSSWRDTPRGRLALVILLDQLSRNIHRGTPQAFANDRAALALCREALQNGHADLLHPVERSFLLMPLMHAEDRATQQLSVEQFGRLAASAAEQPDPEARALLEELPKHAAQHAELVERFGRFPHRNAILGRTPTAEEQAYLAQGGATFGQAPRQPDAQG